MAHRGPGAHKVPAHKGAARKGPGVPQGPKGAYKGLAPKAWPTKTQGPPHPIFEKLGPEVSNVGLDASGLCNSCLWRKAGVEI